MIWFMFRVIACLLCVICYPIMFNVGLLRMQLFAVMPYRKPVICSVPRFGLKHTAVFINTNSWRFERVKRDETICFD